MKVINIFDVKCKSPLMTVHLGTGWTPNQPSYIHFDGIQKDSPFTKKKLEIQNPFSLSLSCLNNNGTT